MSLSSKPKGISNSRNLSSKLLSSKFRGIRSRVLSVNKNGYLLSSKPRLLNPRKMGLVTQLDCIIYVIVCIFCTFFFFAVY